MRPLLTARGLLETVADDLLAGFVEALPTVVGGLLVFLALATAATVGLRLFRAALRRAMPAAEPASRQFVARIVAIVVLFGVGLASLSVAGLDDLAASLGTATGFLALGVAYALSGMLADAVAGVYLLGDPDFNPGDEVRVGDMTGTVAAIELRKTRFAVDGDTVVRANAEIEQRWTKLDDARSAG